MATYSESTVLAVDLGSVVDQLTCAICGGLLRSAATLKECFHTFCRVCLLKHLNQRKSACPKCQVAVEGLLLDCIVDDPKMQNLVDALFPVYANYEAKMRARMLAWLGCKPLPTHLNVYNPEVTGGIVSARVEAMNKASTSKAMELLKGSPSVVILHLTPDANCTIATRVPKLKCPHLMVSGDMPVGMLAQFIANQLDFEAPAAYKLDLVLGGEDLPPTQSIDYVCRSRRVLVGVAARPVNMNYRFNAGATQYTFNKN